MRIDKDVSEEVITSYVANAGLTEDLNVSLAALVGVYETLLAGIMFSRYPTADRAVINDRINKMFEWLEKTDFFTAPASTRYHDSYPGGLLVHSLKVYNAIIDLRQTDAFKNVNLMSACLVALVHDWCKIDFYEGYMKNVKDDNTGQWHQEQAWRVNQKGVPLGHGVTSMFLAQKFFNLTTEESLAIRWHMGRWNTADIEVDELQSANAKIPLVYLLQFADQLACTNYS